MTAFIRSLTDVQLERNVRIIRRRIDDAFRGGNSYGTDWPTLHAVMPQTAAVLRAMLAEGRSRVESLLNLPALPVD